ncbi:MAG TPA: glycosyltransferase family 1 protein [Dokdonella sp.]
MHVAIVTETWPREVNGVALTVQALARGVAALGHRVEVLRPRQREESRPEQGIEEVLLRGAAVPRYPGLRFGLPASGLFQRRWAASPPDAIYVATEGPLGHSALRAARRLRIPACTGFHTRFDDFARHYGLGFLAPTVFACLRRFHNHADATLVPTPELAGFLEANGFRNVHLLRRAVDTRLFDPARRDENLRAAWGAGSGDLVVVHVGRLAPEKNLDLALRAFAAIRARHPRARCVVVGDGPSRDALQQAHPEVRFAGMQRGEDLARHFASGDLFLFPSLTETFGNVTLESLASGVPVVAFDYGAAREHLRGACAGARVAIGDADAFVDAALVLADRLAAADADQIACRRERVRAEVADLGQADVAGHFARLLDGLRACREVRA